MNDEPIIKAIKSLEAENQLLHEAVNAAHNYIHSSQDDGLDSQRRYDRWMKAKEDLSNTLENSGRRNVFDIVNDTIEGLFDVRFTNDITLQIDVKRQVIDTRGFPMWLEDKDGVIYNYQNIISIKKVP